MASETVNCCESCGRPLAEHFNDVTGVARCLLMSSSSRRRSYPVLLTAEEFDAYQVYATLPESSQAICLRFVREYARALSTLDMGFG